MCQEYTNERVLCPNQECRCVIWATDFHCRNFWAGQEFDCPYCETPITIEILTTRTVKAGKSSAFAMRKKKSE